MTVRDPTAASGRLTGWNSQTDGESPDGRQHATAGPLGVAPSDVTLVQQQFDMQALLSGEIDAAQAMSYNEYAQVLEATNPATGQLYQPSDFNVINWNDAGTAMLQDAIWANTERLSDPAYQDTTTKFIAGSLEGWAYCRDNPESCRDIVVKAGSKLGASHQLWQVNEINKLIWPSPAAGVGTIDLDTVTLLNSNPRFIEAYMVGLNHELAGDRVRRRFPPRRHRSAGV